MERQSVSYRNNATKYNEVLNRTDSKDKNGTINEINENDACFNKQQTSKIDLKVRTLVDDPELEFQR